MIAALALSLAMQAGNPVIETVVPDAKFVSVQVIVTLPPLSGRERAEAQVLAETMADDVEGYVTHDMRDIAARAGESLRITLMPDHMRLQIGVLPVDVKPAIAYLDAIVRNSKLPAESLNKAMAELPFRNRSLWATALQPFKLEFNRIKRDEIVDLYKRICRPENVWLSVGGPISPGEAEEYWQTKNKGWKPGKAPRPSSDRSMPVELDSIAGREAMIELRGKEILGSDPAIAARLMALVALGSGKGSAMFSRLREGQGWSYRQEALLWPSANGFVPRLIMASGDKTPAPELAKAMKEQLTEAANAWTDADVARARGMAEGILTRGMPMSPLYFNPYWPVWDTIHDRTFLAGYWLIKTGREWEPRKLVGQMALLTLPELKEAALEILTGSEPHILAARG